MANIPAGYGVIAGRGRENAQKALAAAVAAGVDPIEVRTVNEGYLVPEKVLVEFEKGSEPKAEEKPKAAPRKRASKKSAESPAESEEAAASKESDKKEND